MDKGHGKSDPSLGSNCPPKEPPPSELYRPGLPRSDIAEVPEDVPIVLHDVLQRFGVGGTRDKLCSLMGVAAVPELRRGLPIGLAEVVPLAAGHEKFQDEAFVHINPIGDCLQLGKRECFGTAS